MFAILFIVGIGAIAFAAQKANASPQLPPRPRPQSPPSHDEPVKSGNWRDLATTSQYETAPALEQFPGYSMLDEYEREIVDYVNEQVDSGAALTEDAIKVGAVALFGPAAIPVLDRLFASDWWQSKKQWIKDKFGDAVGEVKDAGEDALEWADENLNPFRLGGIPVEGLRQYARVQAAGLEEFIPLCEQKLGQYVGSHVDVGGTLHEVTLSGVCGIADRAGMRGAQSWLNSPSDHLKFPATTQAFLETNGLF